MRTNEIRIRHHDPAFVGLPVAGVAGQSVPGGPHVGQQYMGAGGVGRATWLGVEE